VRVFKTKWFDRFARKMGIVDTKLIGITTDLEQGQWDADLGGDVYKIRLARLGEGKSGGYRTIVIFRSGKRVFFHYGYPKSARGNIDDDELAAFKDAAKTYLALTEKQLDVAVAKNALIEIQEEL
jgi:hypothetical protein